MDWGEAFEERKNKSMPEENHRLQQLEARTYHMDGKLAAVETQVTSVVDSLKRIEGAFLNRPSSWTAGTTIAGAIGVCTVVFGILGFNDNQLSHMQNQVDALVTEKVDTREFRQQVHYEMGIIEHTLGASEKMRDHFDSLMHKRDDRINEIENTQHRHISSAEHNNGYK